MKKVYPTNYQDPINLNKKNYTKQLLFININIEIF